MAELRARRGCRRLGRLRPLCIALCTVFVCLAACALPPVDRSPLPAEQHQHQQLYFSLILVDLWPFQPDTDVELDTTTLQPGQRVTHDVELRLMAKAAVPLCFDMTLGRDVATMIELVQFASAEKGVCPAAFFGRVALYFRLMPEKLTTWYGAARLALLQHMQLPTAWSVVRATESCLGPACTRAEAMVAEYATVNPPGQIYTRMPVAWGYGPGAHVPLADIHVLALPITFHGMPPARQLFVDLDATVLRRARRSRIRAKRAYAAGIERYDAALRRQSEAAGRLLSTALAREERATRRQVGVRVEYQRYMRSRRNKASGELRMPPTSSSARRAHKARRRQACDRLRRAGDTLTQQAVLSGDSRLRQLRQMQRRWRCAAGTRKETGVLQASDVPCEVFCDATAQLLHWQADTGHTFSLSQMLALFAALLRQHDANSSLASVDEDESKRLFDYSVYFVERQQYTLCRSLCRVPSQLVAEMRYAVGVLQLLQPDKAFVALSATPASHTQRSRRMVGTAVRGVLNLQQAMWTGSRQASAALATLREHGILQRQHVKAAYMLLLHALAGLHGDFYHQLLPSTSNSPAGLASASGSAEANVVKRHGGASHLQRHLHYFAARHNFDELDHPLLTRDTLRAVWLSEEYSTVGAEEPSTSELVRRPALERGDVYHGEGHETRLVLLENMLLKATFMLAELQNNPPDVRGAECRLLTALRRMGYLCDLAPEERAVRDLPGTHRLMQICPRHTIALQHVLQNETYPRVRCAPRSPRTSAGDVELQVNLVALPSERHYRLLQRILLKLSQVYVLDGVKSGRAARYAALSLRLAYTVYVDTVDDFFRMFNADWAAFYLTISQRSGVDKDELSETDRVAKARHSTPSLVARLSAPSTSQLPAPWRLYQLFGSAERYRTFVKRLVRWLTAKGDRLGRKVTPEMIEMPTLAESFFLHTESLVFLALSGLHAVHDAAGSNSSKAHTVPLLLQSPLYYVQDVLQSVFNVTAPFSTAVMSNDGPLETFQEACTYLIVAAAGMWGSLGIISTLDHTLFVHDTDAILLLHWLISDPQHHYLHHKSSASDTQLRALQQLRLRRLVEHADDYSALFRSKNLLPTVQDTVESYSGKLLRFAQRRVGGSGPIAELLRRGLLTATEAASPFRQTVARRLDDAPLWPHRLRALRHAQRYYTTRTDFTPLLYLSDLHDHLNTSRKTALEALGERVLNALRYLVTETTQEALVRETGLQILRPPSPSLTTTVPEEGYGAQGTPPSPSSAAAAGYSAPFVQDFVEAVAALPQLRQLAIAAQLLSAALQSGAPQGFALLFFEVNERDNVFLRPMANYLAGQVWGPQTASAWREVHKASQWQQERVRPGRYGVDSGELMTMNLRSPFLSTASEPRQELLARVDRHRASHAVRRSHALSHTGQLQRGQHELAKAEKILALCSGYLVYMATVAASEGGNGASLRSFADDALFARPSFLHSPYDGTLLPAGAASCLIDLYKLRTATKTEIRRVALLHSRGIDEIGVDTDESLLLRLVKEVTTRQQYYYYLARKRPDDALPPSVYALGGTPQDVAYDSPGIRPPRRDNDEERSDEDVKRDYRVAQLVEPWQRVRHRLPRVTLSRGEGVVYNTRLHRVTGEYWGAELLLWWREVKVWVRWLLPHTWQI